jgi:diguanylate cyclase (GGDEF)-like protein
VASGNASIWIVPLLLGAVAFVLGWFWSDSRAREKLRAADRMHVRLSSRNDELGKNLATERDERQRLGSFAEDLRRTVARIPWMAQDLLQTHEAREIPGKALALIEEFFAPRYSVFLMVRGPGFVVSDVRGESPFELHASLGPKDGVVAWSAEKQLILTPEEVALETTLVKDAYFSGHEVTFEFCIPVVHEAKTRGVILVGPVRKALPSAIDFARTVGIMTAVSMWSARVIADQTRLAVTDGLTGLLNKKRVHERLQELLAPGEKERRLESLGVFLFDIDHFKKFNDTNGHLAGDELLRAISALLRKVTREGEVIGRYGGEEFLLLMPGATREDALRGAERVRAAIAEHAFAFGDGQPSGRVTVSGGVAAYPQDGRVAAELIEVADRALYEAKRQGRNRVLAAVAQDRVMSASGALEAGAEDDEPSSGAIVLTDQVR